MTRIGGIVLCGGQSSRMGRSKAWLPFGDEFMLQRVVRLIQTVVNPVVVVAAPAQDIPPLTPDVEIARDPQEGRGPLQGLVAGLKALRGHVEAVYLSSCDAPFLRSPFIHRLIELLGDDVICVSESAGFRQPLAAIYRVEVEEIAARLLSENRLSLTALFQHVPTRIVQPDELSDVDATLESLRNLNSPEDYEKALRETFPLTD